MAAPALVPLAMFLLNETTRDLYVMPAEAAARIDGAKPCASIKLNIVVTEFSASSLDQMCASLAQGMLPKINPAVKTTWSSQHASDVGSLIHQWSRMGGVRREPSIWPPDAPFSVLGLSRPAGVTVVFGVRTTEKQPTILERVDTWSQVDGRFLRSYWSRAIHDPTNAQPVARILHRAGAGFQRAWRAPSAPAPKQDLVRLLVDKKITERELASMETVIRAYSKGPADIQLVPIDVRKEGILYQTQIPKLKLQEIVARLTKEMPAFRTQSMTEGPIDISLMVSAPR